MNQKSKQELFNLMKQASNGDTVAQEELRKAVIVVPSDGKPADKQAQESIKREQEARKVIKDLRDNAGKHGQKGRR